MSPIAKNALNLLQVDQHGLDIMDRKLLETIVKKFKGGPVGLDSLAAAIGEDSGTIEEVIEPFLIQEGYIERTNRGRVVTDATIENLGLNKKT